MRNGAAYPAPFSFSTDDEAVARLCLKHFTNNDSPVILSEVSTANEVGRISDSFPSRGQRPRSQAGTGFACD